MRIVKLGDYDGDYKPRQLTPEELAEAYALSKAAFTAADLQRYTEEEEGIPMEELLKELEEAQRKADAESA